MVDGDEEAHLERAQRERRVILTQDEDSLRLHATSLTHTGIVYAAQHLSNGDLVRRVMLIVHVLDAEEMHSQVEYLSGCGGVAAVPSVNLASPVSARHDRRLAAGRFLPNELLVIPHL